MSWIAFWNGEHSMWCVNARHLALYYERLAQGIVGLIPSPVAHVLDYGCGEALASVLVAQKCARLALFDPAPRVQDKLRGRFAGCARIAVLDETAVAKMPSGAFDLIICNSVLQYLTKVDCEHLVVFLHEKLKSGGCLVIGDVISPDTHIGKDILALLAFAWEGKFLLDALRDLVATYFSNYRKLRKEIGLTTFTEPDLIRLLSTHGFEPRRLMRNIGYNQARMTFIATRL
jgi:SAM-dependent methyltransferase